MKEWQGSGFPVDGFVRVAFGLDSIDELISAGVSVWRLTIELRQGRASSEEVESRTRRIAGGLLFVLAAYEGATIRSTPPHVEPRLRIARGSFGGFPCPH
jgi:hypothetical protein